MIAVFISSRTKDSAHVALEPVKAKAEPVVELAILKDPAVQKWLSDVAKLPATEQVQSVAQKLRELNPGFDEAVMPTINNGVVTKLDFVADHVTQIWPVRGAGWLESS